MRDTNNNGNNELAGIRCTYCGDAPAAHTDRIGGCMRVYVCDSTECNVEFDREAKDREAKEAEADARQHAWESAELDNYERYR